MPSLIRSIDTLQVLAGSTPAFEPVYGVHGTPSDGNVPKWVAANGRLEFGTGGGGSSTLAADTDVSIVTPADRNLLIYHLSDAKWHNDVLVAADIPALDASKITTGTLPEARGGTNQSSYAKGDLLYASAANTLARRAAGTAGTVLAVQADGTPGWSNLSSSGGGSGVLPYWVAHGPFTKPAAPGSLDEYWDDTTGMSGPTNGLDASWSTTGASQSRAYQGGFLLLSGPSGGGTAVLYKAAPATPYTVTCCVVNKSPGSTYNVIGPCFRASSSTKLWALGLLFVSGTNFQLQVERYSSPGTRASFTSAADIGVRTVWLRITYDGTTLAAQYSIDGLTSGPWATYFSEAKSSFFGTDTIDGAGILIDNLGSGTPVASVGPVVFG